MRSSSLLVVAALSVALSGCGGDDSGSDNGKGGSSSGGTSSGGASSGGSGGTSSGGSSSGGGAGQSGVWTLTSTAYTEGATIPEKYECTAGGGQNVSPPLAWTTAPAATQSYAIVMRDLDFQNGFIHWVIWDIPADVHTLPEGVEAVYQPATPAGAKQAPSPAGSVGYFGPCSPTSVNTYELTIFAIPTATIAGLSDQSTREEAATEIDNVAIGSAKLAGES